MKALAYDIPSHPINRKCLIAFMQFDLNAQGLSGRKVVSISSSEFANVGHTVFLKRETTAIGATA